MVGENPVFFFLFYNPCLCLFYATCESLWR